MKNKKRKKKAGKSEREGVEDENKGSGNKLTLQFDFQT